MALAAHWSGNWPVGRLRQAVAQTTGNATRKTRITVVLVVVLVCTCFAAATALQMHRDYTQALAMAETYTQAQARVLGGQMGRTLDRLATLGALYADADDRARAAEWIEATEGARILNIGIVDANGHFVAAMKGHPPAARPLSSATRMRGERQSDAEPFSDPAIGSSSLTLIFRTGRDTDAHLVVMPLDPLSLLPQKAMGDVGLFAANGQALALNDAWKNPPAMGELPRAMPAETLLHLTDPDGTSRIVAFSPVPGWPIAAAASVSATQALSTWYGSVPLYLFAIIGPAVAGAALAVLLVRAFERADRARAALVAVKAIDHARRTAGIAGIAEAEWLARLAESEERAATADRAKADFAAYMSHELRTPLNAIIGFAELIQTGLLGPRASERHAEYARDIASAGRALHQRIGDILEFAASEFGAQPLAREPVDIGAIATSCVARAREWVGERRITLETELPPMPALRGDPAAVQRIVTVFLATALRYAPEEGIVRVESRRDGAAAILIVRGTSLSALSPRFPKGHANPPGFELGLATATNLARRMGGAVRISGATDAPWAELRLPFYEAASVTNTNHIPPVG